MKKNNNKLVIVRLVENFKIIIKFNSCICIKGYIDMRSMVYYLEIVVIFEYIEKLCLLIDLDIVLICFNYLV